MPRNYTREWELADEEIARLKADFAQAKEAIAHLELGKPLGELVGKQTIANQMAEIAKLKLDYSILSDDYKQLQIDNERLKAELALSNNLGLGERAVNNKLREALEVAREVFRNSERPARLGADHEMIAEALLIGLRGCDEALEGKNE